MAIEWHHYLCQYYTRLPSQKVILTVTTNKAQLIDPICEKMTSLWSWAEILFQWKLPCDALTLTQLLSRLQVCHPRNYRCYWCCYCTSICHHGDIASHVMMVSLIQDQAR